MKSVKANVLRQYPDAHCVRSSTGMYIVWPSRRCGPRGEESGAIGIGNTPIKAWGSVYLSK